MWKPILLLFFINNILSQKIRVLEFADSNCDKSYSTKIYSYDQCLDRDSSDSDSYDEGEIENIYLTKINNTYVNLTKFDTKDCIEPFDKNFIIELNTCFKINYFIKYKLEEINVTDTNNSSKYLIIYTIICIFGSLLFL